MISLRSQGCGSCTACCTTLEVPELNKPSDTPCGNCKEGKGCTAYAIRPVSCRKFECLWLQEKNITDELRPDNCGVLVETFESTKTVAAYAVGSRGWNNPTVRNWFESLARQGRGVVLASGNDRHFFAPEGRTPEQLWDDLLTEAKLKGIR